MEFIDLLSQWLHLGFRLSRYGVKELALSTSHGITRHAARASPLLAGLH
jgi:hypothetical protein